MNTWSNFSFLNANSPMMENLIYFHDTALIILILITVMVSYMILSILSSSFINRFMLQGHMIEIIWTILPMLILLFMAFPSLKILYLLDDIYDILLSVKISGHQWYWSYEYPDFNKTIEFNSYMQEYSINNFRLLEVDNRMILPFQSYIRLLVSSVDVIHSWTVPSLGLKVDATPGRINQMLLIMNRPGLFFGQCSEICGANHSFMPIVIESTSLKNFLSWISSNC